MQRFLALLADGFASRRIFLEARTGGAPEDAEAWGWEPSLGGEYAPTQDFRHAPGAILVGLLDAHHVLLFPEVAHQFVAGAARATDERFPVELPTLLKRLDDAGLIVTQGDRRTTKFWVGERQVRVIKLRRDALAPSASDEAAPQDRDAGRRDTGAGRDEPRMDEGAVPAATDDTPTDHAERQTGGHA